MAPPLCCGRCGRRCGRATSSRTSAPRSRSIRIAAPRSASAGARGCRRWCLIGARDDVTSSSACHQMVDGARGRSALARIVVYPEAYHDFDRANLPLHAVAASDAEITERGHVGTDADARKDAQKQVAEWLSPLDGTIRLGCAGSASKPSPSGEVDGSKSGEGRALEGQEPSPGLLRNRPLPAGRGEPNPADQTNSSRIRTSCPDPTGLVALRRRRLRLTRFRLASPGVTVAAG